MTIPRNVLTGIARGAGLLLILLALALIPTQPARAATLTVNSIADAVVDDANCSLREAMLEANRTVAGPIIEDACGAPDIAGADSITLPDGTYTLTSSALPQVTTEITINGAGAATTIVEAANAPGIATWRVFDVDSAGSLTLNSITVRHGQQIGGFGVGGGIYNAGTLILDASTVSRNSATLRGGGIYNVLASATLIIQHGSVIGGAGTGNTANGGGGIYNGAGGQVTIDASTVSANAASGNGGGIFGETGTVTIQNGSTVGGAGAANTATSGGGIYISGTAANITQVTIAASTVSHNSATDGGGIFNSGGRLTLDASTVSNNTASTSGGGIYQLIGDGFLRIQNGSVIGGVGTGNGATEGGGIYNGFSGQVTIDASTVSGNTASNSGGGIYNTATVTIRNGSTVGGAGAANTAAANGGGIYSLSGQVTVNASTVSHNSASGGGGIYAHGTLTIENGSTISGNSATLSAFSDGGGIFKDGGTATIDASTVSNNTATQSGGGIYAAAATVTIRNGSTIGGAGAANTAVFGGGIYNSDGRVTIDASTVSHNNASAGLRYGGGIYNDAFSSSTVTIQNGSTVGPGNLAIQGAGLYSTGTGALITLTNSTVTGNGDVAANQGGGIRNQLGSEVILNNSRVTGNRATNGGGIYNSGLNAIVRVQNGSQIGQAGTPNTSPSGAGGGIFNQVNAQVFVSDSSISYNEAQFGGGIQNITGAQVTVDASTVSANTAATSGGGIYNINAGSTVTIQNGSVIGGAGAGNRASNVGGGVYNLDGTATISNSTISSNTATNDGDALLHLGGTSSASNSCIIGNGVTAVSNLAVTAQNFANNWWGAASGPGGVGPGTGDSVSALITFAPFLTSDAGTPCGPPLAPAAEVVAAAPSCPALDLSGTASGSITPGGRASVTFTVKNPNSAGSCASDVLNISVPGGLNMASVTTTQGQITSQIPPTLSVNLGSISPGAEVVVTVTLSLPQSAAIHGLARPIAQSQYCLTGSTTGDTATVCLTTTPEFPTTLPNTGGQPVKPLPWAWIAAGIAAAGLAFGGWRRLTAPRRS